MIIEYEIWRVAIDKVGKFATRDNRDAAVALADRNAADEPGVLWEVYEVTSERIHCVEVSAPATPGSPCPSRTSASTA